MMEKLEDIIMNKLDLDEYNLTSDDLRDSSSGRRGDPANRVSRISKGNVTRVHPLVPKLDLQKIFDWREKSNNDNIIMIRISESRIDGEDEITEEVNDENGIEKENKKHFPKGSGQITTSRRVDELMERKQMIITALNQAYTEDDEEMSMTPKEDTIETE